MKKPCIIFLNGTAGSGKTSLAIALQNQFEEPFWHVSSDQFIAAQLLPKRDFEGGRFEWRTMRPHFFEAFHNCLPAIAKAKNNIIVDHIIESVDWLKDLQILLLDFDVFFVGVHCELEELKKREIARITKDPGLKRFVGEAEEHLHTHTFCQYDFEVDTSNSSVAGTTERIISAWKSRKGLSHFFKDLTQLAV